MTPPTLDTEPTTTPEDIEANKVFAILAYIGLLWLVPFLFAKESKFARFHTNEGLVLFLAMILLSASVGVLAPIPLFGWLLVVSVPVLWIGFFILMVIGILNAAQGKMKPVPLLGGRFSLIKV